MKKLILLLTAIIGFSALKPSLVHADEQEKTQHYEAKEFSNAEGALSALVSTSIKMANLADDKDIDDVVKMEEIHQISYTTENAVVTLAKNSEYDLNSLAVALEEVHLASEKHDAEDLKSKFITYQAELNKYLAQKN